MAVNRKSLHDKALSGSQVLKNARKTKLQVRTPRIPEWLPERAVPIWHGTVRHLKVMGIACPSDGFIIAAFSVAVSHWIDCERAIEERGLTFQTDSGYVQQRPEAGLGITYLKQAITLGSKLGLSPLDRERLSLIVERPEEQKGEFYIVD